ncbi:MAG: L,D-transpeptidase [Deltaproteobacteria bacterium]|nr:L,D-transpeptidase [Deltaproteobacteria bacterium]
MQMITALRRSTSSVAAAALAAALLFIGRAASAAEGDEASPATADHEGISPGAHHTPGQIHLARRYQPIYRGPAAKGPMRGLMTTGETFLVVERVKGSGGGCKGEWGRLAEGGYTCLDTAPVSDVEPVMQPRLVSFDHPTPDEYREYVKTGTYERSPIADSEALVPFVYGKRWRRWNAPAWSSLAAYEKGGPPTGELEAVTKFHFVEAIDTQRGTVLRRADGTVSPADKVYIYPIDRFKGRDFEVEPIAEGLRPAWVVNYDGAGLRETPDAAAPVVTPLMPFHTALSVAEEPATPDGKWWRVPDGIGPGQDGYVIANTKGVRVWKPLRRPTVVGDDDLWVDVDTSQQMLGLMRGDRLVFATLVSTGEGVEWATPHGVYRVYDKSIHGDMKSRDDAEEAEMYNVERVPWVMHFRSRYALHGVFWHWGFGLEASHGCINLSVQDARYLFDRIGPTMGPGWHTTYATPSDPGTILRVRADNPKVPDLRAKLD